MTTAGSKGLEGTIVIPQSTQEQRKRAQIAVCARATDVEDAKMLLECLDLASAN